MRNKIFALHHLSTCARVKANVKICKTKTATFVSGPDSLNFLENDYDYNIQT
jgi:hypothetical protein